jgi:peptidoglycan/xylan/chitin deacetylase (PgdA/CDA1 family)
MKFFLFISFVSAAFIPNIGFRCGKDFNGDICPESLCCSQYGWCGSSLDYCSMKNNCQSNCLDQTITSTSSIQIHATTSIASIATTSPIPSSTFVPFAYSCTKQKNIAMTFDDGPSEFTNDLLTYLSSNNIPATFFVIGQNIAPFKNVLKRMSDLNFKICNHSWDHSDFLTLTSSQIKTQITKTNALIQQITGTIPNCFRFPYLSFNSHVQKIVNDLGMSVIDVSLDTNDWKYFDTNPELIYQAFTNALPLNNAYISLQHDRLNVSVQMVPKIIQYIKSREYKLVSLHDCIY